MLTGRQWTFSEAIGKVGEELNQLKEFVKALNEVRSSIEDGSDIGEQLQKLEEEAHIFFRDRVKVIERGYAKPKNEIEKALEPLGISEEIKNISTDVKSQILALESVEESIGEYRREIEKLSSSV